MRQRFQLLQERHNISLLKELRFVWDDGCYKHLAPIGANDETRIPGAFGPSLCPQWLINLDAIAKSITNRQNLCAQLWMINEVLVEFAQGLRRWLLIRRTNLAGNLTAPQEIVT